MTQRNSTPPGARYQTPLGKALSENAMPVSNIRPNKEQRSVEDWLRADHQRNEFRNDVEQIKCRMDRLYRLLCIEVSLVAAIIILQLIISLWG